MNDAELKVEVAGFWDEASCGEVYATGESKRERYEAQSRARYELEPYLREFARFEEAAGRDVLEVGVGMGSDHVELAKAGPRLLYGVDPSFFLLEQVAYGLFINRLLGMLRYRSFFSFLR